MIIKTKIKFEQVASSFPIFVEHIKNSIEIKKNPKIMIEYLGTKVTPTPTPHELRFWRLADIVFWVF